MELNDPLNNCACKIEGIEFVEFVCVSKEGADHCDCTGGPNVNECECDECECLE